MDRNEDVQEELLEESLRRTFVGLTQAALKKYKNKLYLIYNILLYISINR